MNAMDISVPYPDVEPARLRIVVGPCRLRVTPGTADALAAGSYEDPTGLLPVHVTRKGDEITVAQSTNLATPATLARAPVLELRLGTGAAYHLTLDGGANETVADLGGLPLTSLTLHQGAGRNDIDFSAPNPTAMTSLDVLAGGVALAIRGLGNANFAAMTLSGGAAQYRLDFGGRLQRSCEARLNTGVAAMDLLVPATTATRVRAGSTLGGLDIGDGFSTRDGAYWNQAAMAGQEPALSVVVSSVLGAVRLRTT